MRSLSLPFGRALDCMNPIEVRLMNAYCPEGPLWTDVDGLTDERDLELSHPPPEASTDRLRDILRSALRAGARLGIARGV